MAQRRAVQQKALTREVLVKELRAFERRIDTVDEQFDKLGHKLDVSVRGLVELIERRSGEIVDVERRLDNHEHRIRVLGTKN